MVAMTRERLRYLTIEAERKGLLVRPDACEGCGDTNAHLDRHHEDYSDHLNVQWICRKCHIRVHHEGNLPGFGRPLLNANEPLTWSPKVRLPERVREWLDEHKNGRKRSALLRELIELGIQESEAEKTAAIHRNAARLQV